MDLQGTVVFFKVLTFFVNRTFHEPIIFLKYVFLQISEKCKIYPQKHPQFYAMESSMPQNKMNKKFGQLSDEDAAFCRSISIY